jgi:methionyl-tRNA formyltransferase
MHDAGGGDGARIVFMGTGPFAVPALTSLLGRGADYRVVGVVTQPDRAAGRGRNVKRGAVAELAHGAEVPVLQPQTFKHDGAVADLAAMGPDVLVVASYGLILPRQVLEIPTRGSLNLHPSLLPRWRGSSPVAGAILAGDTVTGVSIIEMVAKMDAGPIVAQDTAPVEERDTTESLMARLADLNAALLVRVLLPWIAGEIVAVPQDEEGATFTKLLAKDQARLDWSASAEVLERGVRAYVPWPVAYTTVGGEQLRVWSVEIGSEGADVAAGTIVGADRRGIAVQTGDGVLVLTEVQPANGRRMPGSAFALGRAGLVGMVAS